MAHLKQRSKLSCGRKNFYVLVGMSYLRTQANVPLVIHFTFTAIVCLVFLITIYFKLKDDLEKAETRAG